HLVGRTGWGGTRLPRLLVSRIAYAVERFHRKRQRGRHPSDHRFHDSHRVLVDSWICGHHQRNAAGHKSLAPRSHRGLAVRIDPGTVALMSQLGTTPATSGWQPPTAFL